MAVAAILTVTALALTLSQLGGKSVRPSTPIRSGRLAATTAFTLPASKFLVAAANAIATEARLLTRRVKSPVRRSRRVAPARKRSARHHLVNDATATSTSPATPSPSYSSVTSTAAASSQPSSNTPAATTGSNTSHQSQPAFGQNGSLGPGRGASGTQ